MSKKSKIIIISVFASVAAALIGVLGVLGVLKLLKSAPDKPAVSSAPYVSAVSGNSETASSADEKTTSEQPCSLEIYTPAKTVVSTTEGTFVFTGKTDGKSPLTLNGKEVAVSDDGLFSVTQELKAGKNVFTFVYNNNSYVYTVNYRYVIIKTYNPKGSQSYSSDSTLSVSVNARKGSTVTAVFGGKTVTLKEHIERGESNVQDEFAYFNGSFKLPSVSKDTDLGKIVFKAVFNGKSESFSSGNIICKKADIPVKYDPNAAVLSGRYINVGTGKIAEITAYEAETFDAYSTDDWTKPTNNYLPKGTVDYSAKGHVYYQDSTSKKEYAVLRCGRQVYISRKTNPTNEVIPIVKEYAGTLPDHNEININSFSVQGNHTVLTLDTMWKAPFYLDILPQNYNNPKKQDFTISKATYNYIDITFCYATVLSGSITVPKTNPIFSSAKIIKNKSDYTLRLFLKKQGGFYGWDANYNSKGQLVFEFLNPSKVTKADNRYGVSLTGIKILIDVGHGGKDPGAIGFNYHESERNLNLAKMLKAELESMGASVYMTRSNDKTVTGDEKIRMLKSLKPDFAVAVHHDANNAPSANGYGMYYANPFSKRAAELIYNRTVNTGLYKSSKVAWHYYYTARAYYCPTVLTENGFITGSYDIKSIKDNAANREKAKALAHGIADYFLAVSADIADIPTESEEDPPPAESNPESSQPPSQSESEPPKESDGGEADTSSDDLTNP